MLPSIEPIRFKLSAPHAQFTDYTRLYQLLVAPFARRRTRRRLFIGPATGAIIGALLVVAAFHWKLRGTLTVGAGPGDGAIALEGMSLSIGVFAFCAWGSASHGLTARSRQRE